MEDTAASARGIQRSEWSEARRRVGLLQIARRRSRGGALLFSFWNLNDLQCASARSCPVRAYVLIQPKEVLAIVAFFYRDEPLPLFMVCLGHALIFIAAHEIYVHTWPHPRP